MFYILRFGLVVWSPLCACLGKTHIKSFFYSGRTTKRGEVKTPWATKKKLCELKKLITKPHEPLSSREGGGTMTLVVRPQKKLFFMCVFPYQYRECMRKMNTESLDLVFDFWFYSLWNIFLKLQSLYIKVTIRPTAAVERKDNNE